jgi:hypothetical protein
MELKDSSTEDKIKNAAKIVFHTKKDMLLPAPAILPKKLESTWHC